MLLCYVLVGLPYKTTTSNELNAFAQHKFISLPVLPHTHIYTYIHTYIHKYTYTQTHTSALPPSLLSISIFFRIIIIMYMMCVFMCLLSDVRGRAAANRLGLASMGKQEVLVLRSQQPTANHTCPCVCETSWEEHINFFFT